MKYINIYIFKKNISDVYVYYVKVYCQCDFKSHTDNILLHNEHIHHLFFLKIYIFIYFIVIYYIYTDVYIAEKR